MPGYTKAARSIIQGISQQDDIFMIDGQCRDQVNMIPSPVDGLVKRPSTELNATFDFLDVNATYNWFNAEISGDNLLFIIGVDRLFIVRNRTLEQTILFDDDTIDYIDDVTQVKVYLINNKIYILNPNAEISVIPEETLEGGVSAAIWCVGVSQNKTYTAKVNVHDRTDDSIVYSDSATILVDAADETKTDFVIDNLFSGLDGSTWFDKGRSYEVITCKLKDEFLTTHYMTVETDDDASNTYLKSYDVEVKDSSLLPRLAYEGMKATVSVAEGNVDDWYLRFVPTNKAEAPKGETVRIQGKDVLDNSLHWTSLYIDTDSTTVFEFDPIKYSKHTNAVEVTAIESNLYDLIWETVPNNPSLEGQTVALGDIVAAGIGATTYVRATRKATPIIPVKGVWKETAKQGTNNFDSKSLPFVVDYDTDASTWTLSQDEWLPRQVGDEDSAPFPQFVGKSIRSLYEHAGRLVAVTDDEIEVTNTNEYNNWFRETATQLLTTDPFGLTSSQKRGRLLTPITLNGELFIWGDQDQFKLTGSQVSITSSALSGVSSYTSSLVEPIVTGDVIHFVSKTDKYNVVYSFAPNSNTLASYTAEAISDQIATRIPGTVKQLISSYNMNTLLVLTEEEPNKLYLYNYYYNNGRLQQSAWSELQFDFPIEEIFVADNQYQLITKYGLEYRLITLDLKDLVRDDYIHMDMLQMLEFVDGYATPDVVDSSFLLVDYDTYKGKTLTFEIQGEQIYCAKLADESSYTCYLGKTFETLFEPRLVTETSEQGNLKFTNVIKLNTVGLVTGISGSFDVEISGPGFNHTTQYNSSSISRTIYSFNSQAETFHVPVRARSDQDTSIKIKSDSHMPFTITGMYYRYRTSQRGILI